ncbi:hypothetical protein [Undibacterium sp. TC9W]|uniref:hypothetical protein n=1 Tax=Undibacterium sp. TC9W TaxID=3413053 RepID=UPI003BF0534A
MKNLFFVLVLCVSLSIKAMEKNTDSSLRYIITGELSLSNLKEFDEEIRKNPKIKELEFVEVPGSTIVAAEVVYQFQARINTFKLRTFARGHCESTCAFIFLMGFEPTLLSKITGEKTVLSLHPIHKTETGEFLRTYTDDFIDIICKRSDGKITKEFLNKMYEVTDRRGGIFIHRDPQLAGAHIFFQKRYGAKYEILSNLSPADLGIRIDQ